MAEKSISPWRPIALLAVAFLLLAGAGAVRARQQFLTRGIPDELPRPIDHGGAQLGLNIYLQGLDDAAQYSALQDIAAAGIRIVKQPFYYREGEPFDWPASDRLVNAIAQHGLQLVAQLDGDPTRDFAPPADRQHFASWAAEFADRYGDQVAAYIIWDEPNLQSHWGMQPVNAADYAALLAAAAGALRAADSNAVIVAAPLAPTTERGPENLSDVLYLEELYGAGAQPFFDAAAGKPYGFSAAPMDREVDHDTLNFSRAILLREVMEANGDGGKALFAGNWGWNALPPDWQGPPSIWGEVDGETRVEYTAQALQRARQEWPWMGMMFLESWQSPGPEDDPRHGFDVAGTPLERALPGLVATPDRALPGFHLATATGPGQSYEGGWRFSEQFGADISESGDALTLHFWGTEVGLRVRRADYRARLYVTIDGAPAPSLPHDGDGAALVLTAPSETEDYLEIVPVARGLEAAPHVLTVQAYRGWDQWALNGFSIGYRPDTRRSDAVVVGLVLLGILFVVSGLRDIPRARWASFSKGLSTRLSRLSDGAQLLLTLAAALLVTLTGWLTWGEQAAGIYRRLGDGSQLALTAAAASIFYLAPAFLLYLPALLLLFFLIFARPAWGLALVALFFPFYVLPKPLGPYRFSPVEIFVLVTTAATALRGVFYLRAAYRERMAGDAGGWNSLLASISLRVRQINTADYAVAFFLFVATASLFFTERLDVAQNEWRVVVVEPALFYFLMRLIRPSAKEMWTVLDAFVLGGLIVSVYGLYQYALGENVITVAGGLKRLHSIYGSPNNVALYLGRIVPFLVAVALLGWPTPRRRLLYGLALAPLGLSILLTFSKGGLFLGIPAGAGVVFLLWLRATKRAIWPWLVAGALAVVVLVVAVGLLPGLAQRLDLQGTTTFLRLSLWQASLNMFAENPIFGVGLDNFLYAYRGRYILESGWEEPNLNHPHNIVLDFATRLGIAGLIAGVWLLFALLKNLWRLPARLDDEWRPVAIGVAGSVAQMVAHGLVDHSFFLVDLAYIFFLLLGLTIWLRERSSVTSASLQG